MVWVTAKTGPERLLNDYTLREKLQHKTGTLRDSIVHKVLRSVDERLS